MTFFFVEIINFSLVIEKFLTDLNESLFQQFSHNQKSQKRS